MSFRLIENYNREGFEVKDVKFSPALGVYINSSIHFPEQKWTSKLNYLFSSSVDFGPLKATRQY